MIIYWGRGGEEEEGGERKHDYLVAAETQKNREFGMGVGG